MNELDTSNFVIVSKIIPDVLLDIRYHTSFNFVGKRVDGYEEPIAILTKQAALALKKVNDKAMALGYRLKLFDCYRPQMAVNHFIRWAKDIDDVSTKKYFYPDVDKTKLFELGFVAEKSSHTRGSTVDLTLFDMAAQKDIDMGGTFDFFGTISWALNTEGINETQIENRKLLRELMVDAGFIPLKEEWWHFTLENEPYPDTYFNFPVRSDVIEK